MSRRFEQALKQRILVLDGAMGTMLQQQNLGAADFGGPEFEGCNEYLCFTRPDVIRFVHDEYLRAGADVIETNTFGSASIVLDEYNLGHLSEALSERAARIAREAADAFSTPEWPRFVAGSIGPTTKSLSVTGGVTFDELTETYFIQARGLLTGGVDCLLIETSQDLLNVKAAGIGITKAFTELGFRVPILISGTIEAMGTTLGGQNVEAFYLAVEHLEPLAVGLNCATGPEFMRDKIRSLAGLSNTGVLCYPNAGLPDELGHYHETPESFAKKLSEFAQQGWLNLAGGCCGTTPSHIRALRAALDGVTPRRPGGTHVHGVSGLEAVYLDEDARPLLVGERTNVIGSRKFRQLICDEEYEVAAEIGRTQVKKGAHVVDICLANPDRDEYRDMANFLPYLVKMIKAPLMIDSTDSDVVELALKHSQGKAIINSTNLEDGEERFIRFATLAKRYGAALVVGTIDEQGMAVTRERKLEVAKRSYDILVNRVGLRAEDIIFDPLTFPIGTGDENYIGSARETVEGIHLIREELPECPTILGISNVSFGLPAQGREVLNSVFLYECTKAGLGYAIVNSEKLMRYASIAEEERKLAERLLFETDSAVVAEFTAFYRNKLAVPQHVEVESLSLHERLARYIVDGTKQGLILDLEEALAAQAPLDIINGPLMAGMNEVGRLFNNNELIVAEVLQSAEVMKAAVTFLEHFMEKTDGANKGTVLLATVKGDVHDIGKNLVEIILGNNGFKIVNLGIKVAPEELIQAAREIKPDLIGLSGLLVKSAHQMVATAEDFQNAGLNIPLLVGGAALTKKFTYTRIQPKYNSPVIYAKDAMEGLDYANRWVQESSRQSVLCDVQAAMVAMNESGNVVPAKEIVLEERKTRTDAIAHDVPVFTPPDFERHVLCNYPIGQIRPYLNLQMLLGKHLGLPGNVEKSIQSHDPKAVQLLDSVESLLADLERQGQLQAHALYQFFPAQADGNSVLIYDPKDTRRIIQRFDFPRMRTDPFLCLSDFLRPVASGEMDYVGMFTVTAGRGVRDMATKWKDEGQYVLSHTLSALALELAEALAERVHEMMRDRWGFPDPVTMTMRERFIAKYQGIRVSFGYPACPNLDDQAKLFQLIRPQDIGVRLTDGFMMDPEASVSALVFAHPQARYFNVGDAATVGG